MNTSLADSAARAQGVRFTRDDLVVELVDGRTVSVPLAWFPRLLHASAVQRKRWRIVGSGVSTGPVSTKT